MVLASGLFGPVVERVIDPVVGDDFDSGFGIGTMWVNTATGGVFISVDDTVDAAVWKGPVGIGGEVPVEIMFPLSDPLVAVGDTHLTPAYAYKKPWSNAVRRMGAWYVKFESDVSGLTILKLKRNNIEVPGASVFLVSGNSESVVVKFTEFILADNDTLQVEQTSAHTNAIQGMIHIYGYELVVRAGDTL